MQDYVILYTEITVSRIDYGCMKLGDRWHATPITREDINAGIRVLQAGIKMV